MSLINPMRQALEALDTALFWLKDAGGPAALPRSSYCVASTGESLYTETEVRQMLAPTAPAMLIEAAPSLLINFNFNDLERDDVRARLKGLAL